MEENQQNPTNTNQSIQQTNPQPQTPTQTNNPIPPGPGQSTQSTTQPKPQTSQSSTPNQSLETPDIEQNNSTPPKKKSVILKVFIILIIVIGLMYSALFILSKFTSSDIKDVGDCFKIEAEISDKEYEIMKNIADQEERVEYFCKTDEESFDRLFSCLEDIKNESSLSMSIIEAFPKYKNTLEENITQHNTACPDSQISLPL